MKSLKILETHGRSGYTRYKDAVLPLTLGPSTGDALSEFDALAAVGEGLAEWVEPKAPAKSKG